MEDKLERSNPERRFAWLPTQTKDRGLIWLRRYWSQFVWMKYPSGQWWLEARVKPQTKKAPAARWPKA